MKNFLLQFFTWWNGQTLGTRFFTWRKGERVGEDEYGNVYYRSNDDRRWVIYADRPEASAVFVLVITIAKFVFPDKLAFPPGHEPCANCRAHKLTPL